MGERQQQQAEPPGKFRYTMKDITRTFGLSRASIIYYERCGIIDPARTEESGYRLYSEQDVFRIMSMAVLRGAGMAPAEVGARLKDGADLFSPESFAGYLEKADRRIAYDQALRNAMDRLARLRSSVGKMQVKEVIPFYFFPDRAEGGYRDFPKSDNLRLLMENAPIGSLGSRFNMPADVGDTWADTADMLQRWAESDPGVPLALASHWGRTVPVQDAEVIEGLDPDEEGVAVIGGCMCACAVYLSPDLYSDIVALGSSGPSGGPASVSEVLRQLLAFCTAEGYKPSELPFCPMSLPAFEGFYVPLCVPVARVRD